MFKGPKPAGQPRTLRTIAQERNSGASFVPEQPPLETQWAQQYRDAGQEVAGKHPIAGASADPKPFKSVR